MSAYRRQASASIVPPTRSVRLQIARELCYAHRHRRHGRRSQSDQIGRNARYSLDPTDANATLGHGILLEFFPPRQTLPLPSVRSRTRRDKPTIRPLFDGSKHDGCQCSRCSTRTTRNGVRSEDSALRAAIPSRSRRNPKKKLDKKNRIKSTNPYHLEIVGRLYRLYLDRGGEFYTGKEASTIRRIVSRSDRRCATWPGRPLLAWFIADVETSRASTSINSARYNPAVDYSRNSEDANISIGNRPIVPTAT